MAISVNGTLIKRVGVVDDNPDNRDTLSDELKYAQLDPTLFPGPFFTTNELVAAVMTGNDAVICDHHLTRNYAPFYGAEAVSDWYLQRFPPILVTKWSKADIDFQIRRYRRNIPVLLTPEETENPDLIAKGFELCVNEFHGRYSASRKPRQTLLQIQEVDHTAKIPIAYVIVLNWDSDEVIQIPTDIIPSDLHQYLRPTEYLYAHVNAGAETQEELYFERFEYRGGK